MAHNEIKNRPTRHTLLAAGSLIIASSFVLGAALNQPRETAATWTDKSTKTGSFSATSIGKFDAVKCEEIRGGLLGLFTEEIVLSWEAPSGIGSFPGGAIKYRVEWGRTLSVGGAAAGSAITTKRNYHIKANTLVGVGLPLDVAVTPILEGSDWIGPTRITPITQLSLLGSNLIMKCGPLLEL